MRHYDDNNMKYRIGLSLSPCVHIVKTYCSKLCRFIFILNTLYTCLSGSCAINSTGYGPRYR